MRGGGIVPTVSEHGHKEELSQEHPGRHADHAETIATDAGDPGVVCAAEENTAAGEAKDEHEAVRPCEERIGLTKRAAGRGTVGVNQPSERHAKTADESHAHRHVDGTPEAALRPAGCQLSEGDDCANAEDQPTMAHLSRRKDEEDGLQRQGGQGDNDPPVTGRPPADVVLACVHSWAIRSCELGSGLRTA